MGGGRLRSSQGCWENERQAVGFTEQSRPKACAGWFPSPGGSPESLLPRTPLPKHVLHERRHCTKNWPRGNFPAEDQIPGWWLGSLRRQFGSAASPAKFSVTPIVMLVNLSPRSGRHGRRRLGVSEWWLMTAVYEAGLRPAPESDSASACQSLPPTCSRSKATKSQRSPRALTTQPLDKN